MTNDKPEVRKRPFQRAHLRVVLFGLASSLWIAAIAGRLVYLQVLARDSLQERAELQQQQTLSVDPMRGTIYDRNGRELAVSVELESVYAVPPAIEKPEEVAAALAHCLDDRPDRIAERLRSDRRFSWIQRKVAPATADCVRSLDLAGVDFLPEHRRFYPKRMVAAHVLGYVGLDNQGMSGIEYALDDAIRGEPGRQIIWTDARKRRAASRLEQPSRPGRAIQLTLDEPLQYIAETELTRAVEESGAKKGIAIVMRPVTGELLAMAVWPGFNPNRYGAYPASHWRNSAVTDLYEPGSTFKVVVAAAALEEGVVSESERIDCGRGLLEVGSRVIRDHKVFDVLTFPEVVQFSSNIGMIRIGQRLGVERLSKYVGAFGFGTPTGVQLPGESQGLVRKASHWSPGTVASVSFGQEIGVTPLQMIAAINSIGASGYLMRPRMLMRVQAPDGEVLERFDPEPVRRVVSAETAARLTQILVGVVEHGTGQRAKIPGYVVAGKTGTAQKATAGGGYSKTDYVASFAGFVPAYRPQLTGLVILDSPRGDHSGGRAAEVFARIMERSLHHLGEPPRGEGAVAQVTAQWPVPVPLPRERRGTGSKFDPSLARTGFGPTRLPGDATSVPALAGLSARDAVARLVQARLVPELEGGGWVVGQDPPAGAVVAEGAHCRIRLEETTARPTFEGSADGGLRVDSGIGTAGGLARP